MAYAALNEELISEACEELAKQLIDGPVWNHSWPTDIAGEAHEDEQGFCKPKVAGSNPCHQHQTTRDFVWTY